MRKLLSLNFALVGLALVQVGSAATIEWQRVPDDLLSGKGIDGQIESAKQLERPGSKGVAAPISRKTVFEGQLRTSIVQMRGDTLHLPSFPDDEVFCVIVGSVILTGDEDKVDQVFIPGDCGFVQKGWAGVWKQPDAGRPDVKMYREIAIVPASFSFAVSLEKNPPVKAARAFMIKLPTAPGTHQLHDGAFVLEAENATTEKSQSISGKGDETIQIVKGNLTLKSASKSEIFKPGDFVILPKGLNAELSVSAGFRGLVVRMK